MKYGKTLISICSCMAAFFMAANVSADKISQDNKKAEQYYAVGMATSSSKIKYHSNALEKSFNKTQSNNGEEKKTNKQHDLHSFALTEEMNKQNRNKN